MKLIIDCCLFVLDNEENNDIRKNTPRTIKLLVSDNYEPIKVTYDDKSDIKELIREKVTSLIGSDHFHLEQVYTLGEKRYFFDDAINIIYIAITNIENIKKELSGYQLLKFDVLDNERLVLGDSEINYHTEQRVNPMGIEYYHAVETDDIKIEKNVVEILTAYKYLRARVDNTDIIFKFLPTKFSLEDVRQVYEKITNKIVDKSNFRKKIINNCNPIDEKINKGYRPTQLYEYKADENDVWL